MTIEARPGGYNVIDITDLKVTCWCEATVVHVPAEAVKAGRTASCGRRECHEPEAA